MRLSLTLLLVVAALTCPAQKKIFIPEDLSQMNLEADSSQWSYLRSAETRDCVFFWERGFGHDLQDAPKLEGKPMNINLSVLMTKVQSFYNFFRDSLHFQTPDSKATRYKMMVMLNYSLDGTAYGGTYDNFIGALWVAPNRIQDKTMNCMAHELGHCFQLQVIADSISDAWGGTGFYEMTSQWMLWQVNPNWLRDENYHFEAFKGLTYKEFLAADNIYHSPYVLQWWADLHGQDIIAQLYREGKKGETPADTYMRHCKLTEQQFADEMLLGYQHLVDLDFHHARQETRPYACTWTTPLDTLTGHWYAPKNAPEHYGFNIIELPAKGRLNVKVQGKNVKWALVGIKADGTDVYGKTADTAIAKASKAYKRRFLVVMGTGEEAAKYKFRY